MLGALYFAITISGVVFLAGGMTVLATAGRWKAGWEMMLSGLAGMALTGIVIVFLGRP